MRHLNAENTRAALSMLDAIEASEDPDQVAARLIIKSHLSGRKIN